ncbi:pseudouridine synthase [Akkermansiaceae bacterium]|nr:pseudouridine synthase [Akkermansiaceae bacterium]
MVIAFHKPYGVLCQFTPDRPGQKTLAEFGFPGGVYPLGRLDMDSEGLLLLSDQSGMNSRLLDPANAHPRTYHAQVEGIPDEAALDKLRGGGIVIQGHRCLPCRAEALVPQPDIPPRDPPVRVRREIPDTWLSITLCEGKNRQVRRMTAAAGHPTLRLIRISIGDFSANSLASGQWEILEPEEIRKIWL